MSRRQQQEGEEGARVRRGTVSRLAHAWATLLGQLVEAQQVDICLSNFAAFFQVVPARMGPVSPWICANEKTSVFGGRHK